MAYSVSAQKPPGSALTARAMEKRRMNFSQFLLLKSRRFQEFETL
jgi:hypothetical protein